MTKLEISIVDKIMFRKEFCIIPLRLRHVPLRQACLFLDQDCAIREQSESNQSIKIRVNTVGACVLIVKP